MWFFKIFKRNKNKKIEKADANAEKKLYSEPIASATEVELYDTDKSDEIAKNSKKIRVKGYKGAFEIKKSKDGRFVFNLYAANHAIVATSQIYSSAQSAMVGINSVITNAKKASIEDRTLKEFTPKAFPKWEIYIDKGGHFRFRLLASNGNCICHSQGYTQKSTCKKGIESVIKNASVAEIDKVYLKETKQEKEL